MTVPRLLLIFLVAAIVCESFEIVSSNKQVNAILEASSHMPALLIYERDLNRLKEKSFLYQRVESRTADYLRIVVLDCL